MLITDLRTGIVSCNGKSWKLSPGQHQMLSWILKEVTERIVHGNTYWYDFDFEYCMRAEDRVNQLSELVYKGMEGEV